MGDWVRGNIPNGRKFVARRDQSYDHILCRDPDRISHTTVERGQINGQSHTITIQQQQRQRQDEIGLGAPTVQVDHDDRL